jgi:cytochrome b
MPQTRLKVWDLSIRAFHWLLAGLISYQLFSALSEGGPQELHLTVGYIVMALIIFRVLWGIFGSHTARFKQFLRPPSKVLDYLKRAEKTPQSRGHNPVGGYSVLLMLTLISIQIATGLLCDDEIMLSGPLSQYFSQTTISISNQIHAINAKLLIVFIGVHTMAIFWYQIIKRIDLITPMITGFSRKIEDSKAHDPVLEKPILATCLIAVSVGVVLVFLAIVGE